MNSPQKSRAPKFPASEAISIEMIKWHQKIQEITYLEAGQHMRALNQLMWQVPSMVIIINGGLWYGVTLMSDIAARMIFILCILFDIISIITLYRLRKPIGDKIGIQLKVENSYNPFLLQKYTNLAVGSVIYNQQKYKVSTEKPPAKNEITIRERFFCWVNKKSDGNYTVIGCWTLILFLCIVINTLGAICPSLYLERGTKTIRYEFFISKPYVIIDTSVL